MEGYPKLAQLMGNSHADGHFLIFQKFEPLSAQNILYLQAEIVNLQETLNQSAKEDAESDGPKRREFTRDWLALSSAEDCEQWETFVRLRKTLKEYYEAIAQHQMITNIPKPHKSDLKSLQLWLERPSGGNCSFVGADRYVYEKNTSGLGTLASKNGTVDPLTRVLLYSLPKLYHSLIVDPLHRLLGKWVKKPESFDLESNIFFYRDSYFHLIANILGTLIASLILIGSIVVLYFITDMPIRLVVVGVFTAIFSIALSLVTSGTRVEIFAATAAFASVQVVFVGSTTNL
ncbi:hypothetical protein N431DRAFT_418207 [Stipitochalara longipes BDJ]|nr:hypothetical protein N431DRAFT_418207 [Stipitochalara longipes BDJ]